MLTRVTCHTYRKKEEEKNIPQKYHSNCWYRSSDLGVMSPARYPCAKLLKVNTQFGSYDAAKMY